MTKQELLLLLEAQSSKPSNNTIIAQMRGLARDVFNSYGIAEFDYRNELNALSQWLSNDKNYNKAKQLVGKSIKLAGNKEDDSQAILGAFALALGNPIKVVGSEENAKVAQFIPTDFASKSGISDTGIGEWVSLELSNDIGGGGGASYRPITLQRDIGGSFETLKGGVEGIKTTALRMKQLTQEYLKSTKPSFVSGKNKMCDWAIKVLKRKGISDKTKYMGALAEELANPNVVRYQKDPLMLENGKLQSHEFLVLGDRILDIGAEDCDGFTICVGTLAGIMGLGFDYRVAKCNPGSKDQYSHVYNVLHYPESFVDGVTGEKDVVCDIVYMKRLGHGGYGKEPKNFGTFDVKVA